MISPPFVKEPIFDQLPDRPLAHCATMIVLPDGALLTAWFGGKYETAPGMAILVARREAGCEEWSTPTVIAEMAGFALGQPVFLLHPSGELWLFFDVIERPTVSDDIPFNALPPVGGWLSAQPFWQRSFDGGRTWDSPRPLIDYPGLMFRSRPLLLPRRIIVPVYDEKTWQSRMLISDNEGQTWRLTPPLTTPAGNIHPCLVALGDGRLLAYMRTGGQGGVIWRAESADGGDSWTSPTPTNIPNPNSGIDLLRLHSGRLVLAFNNSAIRRTPLCVMISEEDEQWGRIRTLEDGLAEYSYPTLAQSPDGVIHLVYTYRREHIHYACFNEAWLLEGEVFRGSQD